MSTVDSRFRHEHCHNEDPLFVVPFSESGLHLRFPAEEPFSHFTKDKVATVYLVDSSHYFLSKRSHFSALGTILVRKSTLFESASVSPRKIMFYYFDLYVGVLTKTSS